MSDLNENTSNTALIGSKNRTLTGQGSTRHHATVTHHSVIASSGLTVKIATEAREHHRGQGRSVQ